jgi:hypothetical protein
LIFCLKCQETSYHWNEFLFGRKVMTDSKIQQQAQQSRSGESSGNDNLSKQEINRASSGADQRDVSKFDDLLNGRGKGRGDGEAAKGRTDGDKPSLDFGGLSSLFAKKKGTDEGDGTTKIASMVDGGDAAAEGLKRNPKWQRSEDQGFEQSQQKSEGQWHGHHGVGEEGERYGQDKLHDHNELHGDGAGSGLAQDHGLHGKHWHSGDAATRQRSEESAWKQSDSVGRRDNRRSDVDSTDERRTKSKDDKQEECVNGGSIIGVTAGSAILDSMQVHHIEPSSIEAATAIRDLGLEVAQRIIATNEALNAKQEVRITLQEGVLKDTEIFINKDGKTLSVSFLTGSSESGDILSTRSGELQSQLMRNLRASGVDNVEVAVDQREEQGNGEGGGQQRQQQQQQQDGDGDQEQS